MLSSVLVLNCRIDMENTRYENHVMDLGCGCNETRIGVFCNNAIQEPDI
jgi:hypothetical protein